MAKNMRIIDHHRDLLNKFICRRHTIFLKVIQLASLTDTEVALIVYGPDGRLYCYGSPSIDALMDRYRSDIGVDHCVEACGGLDLNKTPPPPPPMETIVEPKDTLKSHPWWEANICDMNSHELRFYMDSLQAMWKDAEVQLEEVEKPGC